MRFSDFVQSGSGSWRRTWKTWLMRRPSSAGPKTRSSATSSSWKRWWRIWKSAKRFLFFSVNHLRFNLYHPAHYVSAHLSVSSSVGCHAQKRNWVHIILGKNLLYNSVYAIKKSSVCICSTHLEFDWVHIFFLHALLPIYCRRLCGLILSLLYVTNIF